MIQPVTARRNWYKVDYIISGPRKEVQEPVEMKSFI